MNDLSVQRKKDIAYKLVKEDGISNFSELTLYKLQVFSSASMLTFKAFSSGISKYALMDFDKAVAVYESETGNVVPKERIYSERIAFNKEVQELVCAYKLSVINEILEYFKDRYKFFNNDYVSLIDFSRYVLALNGTEYTEEDEEKIIAGESIKQRKRIEKVKKGLIIKNEKPLQIRLKETDMVKKDICYSYNLNDLMKIENYYNARKKIK